MKLGIRIIICAVTAAVAASTASMALAGFRTDRTEEQDERYILGAADGLVAVYSRADPARPVEVTGIELASLRESDRALLAEGLPVESREELARLLEDLGS